MRGQAGEADFGIEDWRTQFIEANSAPTLPSNGFGNTALFALDHFAQTRGAMRCGTVAHLDADVAPPHLRLGGALNPMTDDALLAFNSVCPDFAFPVGDTKARMLAAAKRAGLDDAQLKAFEEKLG